MADPQSPIPNPQKPLDTPTQTPYATPMSTQTSPDIRMDILRDLFYDSMNTIDLCLKHGMSLDELQAVVDAPDFQRAIDVLMHIEAQRARALAPTRRERALETLERVAAVTPTTPTQCETVRKAAAALLRAATPPSRKPSNSKHMHDTASHPEPAHSEPSDTLEPATPGRAATTQPARNAKPTHTHPGPRDRTPAAVGST